MTADEALKTGSALLFAQARALDERRWDDWLDTFTDDCEYWVPAWVSEEQITTNPDSEVSLIYYDLRSRLADRVWRVGSGTSVASDPMPRTCHAVTNIELDRATDDTMQLVACFCVDYHVKTRSDRFFGRYYHRLRWTDNGWRVANQKIVVLNDYIPTMLDFYLV